MSGFALLWEKILDSSLWVKESKETRLVWITMLAMRDSEGRVHASVLGLARRARVSDPECVAALKVLSDPDENDTSGVDEGRRIRAIDGGWEIVNHDRYRFSTEAKRQFWAEQKRAQRAKAAKLPVKSKSLPGEQAAEAAREAGGVEAEDRAITSALPESCQ